MDSGGAAAMESWIRPADPNKVPRAVRDLMAWDGPVTAPSYPCLIDESHLVAQLYRMVNVPSAVWIDEEGRMVRPAEPAGVGDAFRSMDRMTYRMPQAAAEEAKRIRRLYIDAIRDWVMHGDASRYALSAEEVGRRMCASRESDRLAAAHFRLGLELFRRGRKAEAERHWSEAARLAPENWRQRRQAWELEGPKKSAGPEFWAAVDALGNDRYYPVIDLG
jgi:tetratricopeptide (TPR) repeat protein